MRLGKHMGHVEMKKKAEVVHEQKKGVLKETTGVRWRIFFFLGSLGAWMMMMMSAWHSIMNPDVSMYMGSTTRMCRGCCCSVSDIRLSKMVWSTTNKQSNKPNEEHKKVVLHFVGRIASEPFWR